MLGRKFGVSFASAVMSCDSPYLAVVYFLERREFEVVVIVEFAY